MKLATLRDGTRDGALVVVRRDGTTFARAHDVARTLQAALDAWEATEPGLRALSERLDAGKLEGEPLDVRQLHAPLPRAYEWVDGSAYLNHVRLVRKARGAEPPPTLETDPLVYQGGSGVLLGPTDDLILPEPAWGMDFESEIVVVLGDVPQGIRAADASRYVRLVTQCNDVSLRNLIPPELAKGFGFFQSKPASAFSPVAVTPDELGDSWRDGKLHLPLLVEVNGVAFGRPDAGTDMVFSFPQLIAHAAKTRSLCAGSIIGSGTISNQDRSVGSACIAERRMLEQLETGAPKTPFLKFGDRLRIDMQDREGRSIFGAIEQHVGRR